MTLSTQIAIVVERLGPYHVARLRAVGDALGADRCVALELAAESREYAWDAVESSGFRRRTVITDRAYQDASAAHRVRKIVAALDAEDPEAVAINGWGFPEARAAAAWCRRRDRVAIVMSESQERDEPRVFYKEAVKRQVIRAFDAGLVSCESHVRYLEKLGMDRARIALGYDIVDNAHFTAGATAVRGRAVTERRSRGLPERYFLCSARFIPKKNLGRLMDAYAAYRDGSRERAWDLVVMGDGALRGDLELQRARLGLERSVHFPGFKQYGDLPAYYGLASAFILPSTSEQWGLVVNEAMASGLPVLVSEACGAASLVRGGENGFTFDPDDVGGMSRLMAHMASAEVDRDAMGRRSEQLIANWGPERFGKGMVEAIRMGDAHRRARSRLSMPNPFLWF